MARQPFFGQGPGPLIARMDMNAATAVGREYGKAFREMGQAAGSAANAFIQRKNEKKRVDSSTNAFIQMGFDPDVAKAMAKDPNFQNAVMKKEALDNQMKIAKMNDSTSRATAGAARAQDAAKMEEDRRRYEIGQDKIREDEESATNIAKFNLDRPELPITEETPAAFLPELDPDPFVGPPTTYQGQAPAVAQLPERFQPQGAQIVDAVQSGQLSPLEGNRIMNSIRGQAMAEQKAGPTRSEILAREQFEYKKATDAEKNKPMPPADPVYQQSALDAIDDAISYVKKDSIINPTAGFLSDTAKGIGGTDAANLDAALSTITSSVGFDRLQAMRDASPTGGALGQVSENELRQLNASLGSISQRQDDEQLLKNLEKIKAEYSSAVKAIEAQRRAYKMGKSFKTKEEALEFMESQSPDTGGIKTSTQGNYKIGDLSVGGYQPGQ